MTVTLKEAIAPLEGSRKELITIDSNGSCEEAIYLMRHHKIHHLVVTSDGLVVGILNQEHILNSLHLNGYSPAAVKCGDICERQVQEFEEGAHVVDIINAFIEDDLDAAFVTRRKNVVHIITLKDVIRSTARLSQPYRLKETLKASAEDQVAKPWIQRFMQVLSDTGI